METAELALLPWAPRAEEVGADTGSHRDAARLAGAVGHRECVAHDGPLARAERRERDGIAHIAAGDPTDPRERGPDECGGARERSRKRHTPPSRRRAHVGRHTRAGNGARAVYAPTAVVVRGSDLQG